MKNRKVIAIALVVLTLLIIAVAPSLAQETAPNIPAVITANVGTAFTYQGYLTDGGSPADGVYDLYFEIFDAAADGTSLGTINEDDKTVVDGLFTVTLDFGKDIFKGEARWLEISVRSADSITPVTVLEPRQELTPAPYALALPGLWTQQNAFSPNIIGGYQENQVGTLVEGATISGGGADALINNITDSYGTIGGGRKNQVGDGSGTQWDASDATIGGGYYNTASGQYATVGGGIENISSGESSTVGGGEENNASGYITTIGGGYRNEAGDNYATICGGEDNNASDEWATIGGGYDNQATNEYTTIGGGYSNTASGYYTTITGGKDAAATHYGEMAYSSGGFNGETGTAQTSVYVLSFTTTNLTPSYLQLGGSGGYITIANGRTATFDILVVGRDTGNNSIGCNFQGVIENVSGTVSFITAPGKICHKDVSAWDVLAEANDTLDALMIQVTGGPDDPVRWVATVRTVEVQGPPAAVEGD